MENLNFDNRIHEQNGLYCLNDIAEKLIGSTNIKEYMKKIPNKEYINGNCYITRDHMIEILLKSTSTVCKEFLHKTENIPNFIDLIHIKNELFCLNDIAEKLLYIKDTVKYCDGIINKKLIHGNYYITKCHMKQIVLKSKSNIGKQYLNYLNDKNNQIIKEEDLKNTKFIDHDTNEIIYDNNRILFFEYDEDIYFKAKDICDLLGYNNYLDAINLFVDKDHILNYNDNLVKDMNHIPKNLNKYNNTIFINDFGVHSLISSSKIDKDEISYMKHWFIKNIFMPINKANSYNNYFNEMKLKELNNIPCLYVINVKNSLYKFGQSKEIVRRIHDHKKNLNYHHINQIFSFPTLDIALNIETRLKHFTKNAKIRRYIDEGNEFFEVNKKYSIETIINEIHKMAEDEMSIYKNQINNIYQNEIKVSKLESVSNIINLEISKQIEKNKEIELEIKKQQEKNKEKELDLEKKQIELQILRLKNNILLEKPIEEPNVEQIEELIDEPVQQPIQQQQIQQPIQPQQIQININNIPNDNNNNDRNKTKKCPDCNVKIHHQSVRCTKCLSKFRIVTTARNTNRPSLEQLELDLRDSSFVQVGKKYNVSDNTIRSWIKQYRRNII